MAEKDIIMTVKLPPSLRDSFKSACYGIDTTPSQELRKFMRDFVKNNNQPDFFTKTSGRGNKKND